MRYQVGLLIVVLGLANAPIISSAIDINTCGQVVPTGDTGVVVADLDCPALPSVCADDPATACTSSDDCGGARCFGAAVALQKRAALDLNGHTLKGGGDVTVLCARDCVVTGAGTIENESLANSPMGIYVVRKATVSDVVLDGGFAGIYADSRRSRLSATNIVASNSYFYGILWYGRMFATNVTANGSGGLGIFGPIKLIGDQITANDNEGTGIIVKNSRITNLTATNNGSVGISAERLRVESGTATGNGQYDLITTKRPRIAGVACDKSGRALPNTGVVSSWGVCASD